MVRADADDRVGSGHVMRCLAVAQAWLDSGGTAAFLMRNGAEALEERLRDDSISVIHLQSNPGSSEDARELSASARELGADWVMVDGYHFSAEYLDDIKSDARKIALMDDLGLLPTYSADIVVNSNPDAESLAYTRATWTDLLLGTKYVPLRREFRARKATASTTNGTARKVLVSMGGADACNATGKVIESLMLLDPNSLDVTVVIGTNNPHQKELCALLTKAAFPVAVLKNVRDMPSLIAASELCIAAGGGTCWEIASLGIPMLLLILAENQASTVRWFEKKCCAVSLGRPDAATSATIASSVGNLLADAGFRQQMSASSRMLIDGRGAERIVHRMQAS